MLHKSTKPIALLLALLLALEGFLPSYAYAYEVATVQTVSRAVESLRLAQQAGMQSNAVTYASEDAEEPVQAQASEQDEGQLEAMDSEAEPETEAAGGTDEGPGSEPASPEAVNPEPTQGDGSASGAEPQGAPSAEEPSAEGQTTAEEDAAAIEGAEVLSDGEDGSGKVLLADEAAVDQLDGRDYVGQTVKEINKTKYILIGNEQQLRAIGTGKHVVDKVWYRATSLNEWQLEYVGDADIAPDQTLADTTYTLHEPLLNYGYYGSNESGKVDVENDASPNTGLTYSADANYIIFRDIDLSRKVAGEPEDNLWTPLMFSGTMVGAVADPGGSIWDGTASSIVATGRPTISNVTVRQAGDKLDPTKYSGIGFFGTLAGDLDESNPFNGTTSQVVVSNIALNHVSVTNESTSVRVDQTLVSGLLNGLGEFVGGLISNLLLLLTFGKVNLSGLIEGLLNVRAGDPSALATGAFVGRVIGNVRIENSVAADISVDSAASMVGGFAGYVEGETRYLTEGLGNIVKLLSYLLNIIPGLGLGDLITLLLDNNILKLGDLLPSSYEMPVISQCGVDGFTGGQATLGRDGIRYVGGFVGSQSGAIVRNSTVKDDGSLSVLAKEYAGGFAGVMHDGQIKGLLENLGVDLGLDDAMGLNPQSLTEGSSVSAPTLTVTAANRAGGFAGAMAASYTVNSSVAADAKLNVSTTESYAGGFAGQMTMGWATNLGVDDGAEDLLGGLSSLIANILKSGDDSGQLLTLAGFEPSAALGCGVSGGSIAVDAKGSYAGGFTGAGEGAVIAQSDTEHVGALTHWQNGGALAGAPVTEQPVTVSGLSSASAKALAGGIAGEMETAAVGGLLNNTLGIGSLKDLAGGGFTAFEVSDATVTGVDGGFTVAVTDYSAGGAIGLATGGEVSNVKVDNLQSVTGTGEVGGFIGQAAAGSALGADGIDLLGLVKLSGLLSVAQSTRLTVDDSTVTGIDDAGFTVTAKEGDSSATTQHTAGGFYGRASSTETSNSRVANLAQVTAPSENGLAGGFVGLSTTGGLASVVSDEDEGGSVLGDLFDKGLLSVDDLLGAVPYMVPSYRCTDVTYVDISEGYNVKGDVAGGYAGLFESGEANVFDEDHPLPEGSSLDDLFAVRNIASVYGEHYAGGFAGKAVSGSLAEAGGGLSLLGGAASIDLTKLLDLVQAYVPVIRYADVLSEGGFTVEAAAIDSQERATSAAAGGFIGYGAAVQVSYSDVKRLAHTAVAAPDDLEASEASSYFDREQSAYAVTAPQYAGGYFGYLNIGSTAGVASGLELLKNSPLDGLTRGISVSDLTSALDVMASTVEHSNVYGHAGGFSVLASGTDSFGAVGHAGGFAGKVSGGQIQDCNVDNFAYIIGQIAAGGYAGEIEPGSVADVLGEATTGEGGILDDLIGAKDLASLAQAFIPTIRNSQTTCVPCGGAVRAQALSTVDTADDGAALTVQRGMAGGYVGHNVGGQIWGNNNAPWKNESEDGKKKSPYNGPQREAAAIRIRSVYGAEYAGGFTGLMEPGSTAETGGLSLLWGLISTDNLLNVMQDIYPTEENTAVYGPLRGLDKDTWNAWVDAVGVDNVYGELLGGSGDAANGAATDAAAGVATTGHVESDDQIATWLARIGYGTNVVAGRSTYDQGALTAPAGCAGGYVGSMVAGTVTNAHAHDTKLVRALRAAGGFVGAAETGGAAKLGDVGILGISLQLGELLPSLVSVFVPVIKCSSVTGYRQGMTVESFGSAPAGGQGQHEADTRNGTGFAGGYIGYGSGAQIWGDADTARDGNAAAVSNIGCTVSGLRRLSATAYAGGFAGKLRAASVASADTQASDGFLQGLLDTVISGTGIMNLAEVLNATMSTVRNANVRAYDEAAGAGDASWGFTVDAYATGTGEGAQKVYPIAAGGFAGAIEATVLGELTTKDDSAGAGGDDLNPKDDSAGVGGDDLNLPVNPCKGVNVSGLRGVDGGNFAGGLVGLADVAGAADVASGDTEGAGASILKLIGIGGVSVLQAFQPCIYAARVDGVADGLTVRAHEADTGGLLTAERRSGNAGGFIGSIMSGAVRECALTNLSAVSGPSYTGGFIGYTGKSGVLDVEDASALAGLLGLSASALNTFSTLVQNSTVAGIPAGYTVASTGSDVSEDEDAWQISGGFVGYADLAHITGCRATALKRVGSGEVAGGFAGKGTHAYLVSADANSPLVGALLVVVGALVKALWLDGLQNTGLIDINLSDWVLHLQVEGEGSTLKASLLGIPIEVTLNDENKNDNVAVAHVKIGSSTIDLKVSKDDQGNVTIDKNDASNIAVNLIKANMTVIEGSSVTGIADGYDVFAGGSTQTTAAMDSDSSDKESGFAGGFMGWSDEAQLKNNEMVYADVIKGAAGLVAPFAGRTDYDPAHLLDTVDKQITGNTYHVYRGTELAGKELSGEIMSQLEDGATPIAGILDDGDPTVEGTPTAAENAAWARFDITGHKPVAGKSNHDDWKDAAAGNAPLDVWRDDGATAVLMANAAVSDNTGSLTPEPEEGQDPCAATADLTITKVWDDHGDTAHRPDFITVELWQSYTDASGKTVSKKYNGKLPDGTDDGSGVTSPVTLSAAEASPWSNTWQHVVKMLPVAWKDGETIRYFSYSVKEVSLEGGDKDLADYATTVTPGEDGTFHIVITNQLPLPETGGPGTAWFALAGAAVAAAGLWLESRRRRPARPAGSHFSG